MDKVAITMRMMPTEHGEWRDAIAQDWANVLLAQSVKPIFVPNNPEHCTRYLDEVKALILTGGDGIVLSEPNAESDDPLAIRDKTEVTLLSAAIERDIPILAVCRGLQLINWYFGGTLKKIESDIVHVAKDHKVSITSEQDLFPEGDMLVNSFHELGIDTLAEELEVFATAPDGVIEGVQHKGHKVMGIMWHPERSFSDESVQKLHNDIIYKFIKNYT